jgi:serine/threonine protein kinase
MNAMIALATDDPDPSGETLRDRLRACQAAGLPGIPAAELLGYMREVADDLDGRHARREMLADVTPIRIRVIDGHARLAPAPAPPPDDSLGNIAGTPAFMAPEVWTGRAGLTSDQYSLAGTYVELRCGSLPFPQTDFVSLMSAHMEGSADLTALPGPEQRVLDRALAKTPRDRYPTCKDLVSALERAVPRRG